jgi:hypothetical protein
VTAHLFTFLVDVPDDAASWDYDAIRAAIGNGTADIYGDAPIDLDDDPAPRPCAVCGARIEPDDGGALWYHADNMSMMCDGDDSTDVTRQADPSRAPYVDDGPTIGQREACAVGACRQDIEWTGRAWSDRGGNSTGSDGHTHAPASDCECMGPVWPASSHGHACPLYWEAS